MTNKKRLTTITIILASLIIISFIFTNGNFHKYKVLKVNSESYYLSDDNTDLSFIFDGDIDYSFKKNDFYINVLIEDSGGSYHQNNKSLESINTQNIKFIFFNNSDGLFISQSDDFFYITGE